MTPGERSLRARMGGLALAASRDPREYTATARSRFLGRFRDQVVAAAAGRGEELSAREIERRAEAARRLYFAGLAMKSATARRKARTRRHVADSEAVDGANG